MKFKSITILVLLFALGFSVVHEYTFAFYDKEHCSVTEYVHELSAPTAHGDICNFHFEYHQSFLLSQKTPLPYIEYLSLVQSSYNESYTFHIGTNLFKPPIA